MSQESARLPDWGKIEFVKYAGKPWEEIVKGASSNGRDLVSKLLVYESSDRLSATEVGSLPFLLSLIHTQTTQTNNKNTKQALEHPFFHLPSEGCHMVLS